MQPSPFLVRKELTDPSRFYGRQRELQEIFSYINKTDPQNVQLVGARRIGKSFLLQDIARNTELQDRSFGSDRSHFTLILWNLANRPPDTPQQFYHELIRHMRGALPNNLADEFMIGAAADDELDDVVDEGLRALRAAGHHAILLLDEFAVISSNPTFPASFFSRLRSLAEGSALAFVIATQRTLSELCHSGDVADSPFFNIFSRVNVGLLDGDETRSFLEQAFVRRDIRFEKGALTEVARLTGGHPCMLATLGNLLWARTADEAEVTHAEVVALGDALYIASEDDFAYAWLGLSGDAQDVARRLAGEGEIAGTSLHKNALRELVSSSLVRVEKNKVALFSSIFRRYVQEHGEITLGSLDQLADAGTYLSALPIIVRARLEHAPSLPPDWRKDVTYAIGSIQENPQIAAFTCGRTLLPKLLKVIASTDGMNLESGDGGMNSFLRALQDRVPYAGGLLPSGVKPFSRITLQELWYLKHLGDCGAHNDEYHLAPRDAGEVVSIAITLCNRLLEAGYSA